MLGTGRIDLRGVKELAAAHRGVEASTPSFAAVWMFVSGTPPCPTRSYCGDAAFGASLFGASGEAGAAAADRFSVICIGGI
jgi:hypothetical protein